MGNNNSKETPEGALPLDAQHNTSNLTQPIKEEYAEFTADFGLIAGNTISVGIIKKMLECGFSLCCYTNGIETDTEFEALLVKYQNVDYFTTVPTIADVVMRSDIILNCQTTESDCQLTVSLFASRMINKKYVELSNVPLQTSMRIESFLKYYNVTYLKAMVQGGRRAALNGNLLIIASGDHQLFRQCKECFETFSKALFIPDRYDASMILSVMQMLRGVCIGGLSEVMGLVKACGIPTKVFRMIYLQTDLANKYLEEKLDIYFDENDNEVDEELQTLHADINHGLLMANSYLCQTSVSSSVNEKLKHASMEGRSEEDTSCLFDESISPPKRRRRNL